MRILVIDDDADDQELASDTLEGHGATIEFANDAHSAVKMLEKKDTRYDKVICDGLFGEWETVYDAVKALGGYMLLYTNNEDYLNLATERGIPTLDKANSVKSLTEIIFPTSGAKETLQF